MSENRSFGSQAVRPKVGTSANSALIRYYLPRLKLSIALFSRKRGNERLVSQSCCQVVVKSYHIVFEKINIEYAPHQKWQQSRRFCIHAAREGMLSNSDKKAAFQHNISIIVPINVNDAVQKAIFIWIKQCTKRVLSTNNRFYSYATHPDGQY